MLKIGYFADGPWAHGAFKLLVNDPRCKIQFVCIRFSTRDSVLIELAEHHNIEVFCVENINSENFEETLKRSKCDLFVSMSFDQIFRPHIFTIPPLGTINCHAGKLPYYRGRNILNWALINDEKEFGITVHYVDSGIDTGDIILQKVFPISEDDDYGTLLTKAYMHCPMILHEAINQIIDGKSLKISQDSIDIHGTIFPRRIIGDELINWSDTSRNIHNLIRALAKPGPQAQTSFKNHCIKIQKSSLIADVKPYKAIPGAVLTRSGKILLVKTGDTYLKILEWECDANIKAGIRLS
ncbi:MAG: formyl transferase [Rhodopirellula sp.]|nr:formyl transferase [Rhodopirellula sp.]